MYKGNTAEKLNEYCAYKCQTGTSPIVTQIDHEKYILTHPPADVSVKCGSLIRQILNKERYLPGALEIQLPCPCELHFGKEIKIPRSFPCDKNGIGTPLITRILPTLWSKLQSININIHSPSIPISFTNISELFDSEWQTKVPHFTSKRKRQIIENYTYDKL